MSQRVFLVIMFNGIADWTSDHGWYEAQDFLDGELRQAGIGLVTGEGYGCNWDVEVIDLDQGLSLIRKVLRNFRVAHSTLIHCYKPVHVKYAVYNETK
jgi:hypothetical protein